MISTKGRYALRVLIALAKADRNEWTSLETVAKDQNISKKYLEVIIKSLVKDGLLEGQRGKGGGYRLTRDPHNYTVLEIIESAEGSLSPVVCLRYPDYHCERSEICDTVGLWSRFYDLTCSFFSKMSLDDLIAGRFPQVTIESCASGEPADPANSNI